MMTNPRLAHFALTSIAVLWSTAAFAAGPPPTQPGSPTPNLGQASALKDCRMYGYQCAQGAQCEFKAPPPPATGPNAFLAYACRYPQPVGGASAASCPSGMDRQAVNAPPSSGSVSVTTWRCVPSSRACPSFSADWQRNKMLPLDAPALGYICGYRRVGG